MDQSQIDKSIVDILTTMGAKSDWRHLQLQKDIFERYIKDWLKEVNDECKKAGWKQKEKLVKYDSDGRGGRCFCIINPRSRIILDMGKFDLREYIQKFEENKGAIREEALQFVAEYPTWTKKYDGIIKELTDYMRERPAFIVKNEFKYSTRVRYHEVELMMEYHNWRRITHFDLYKKVEDFDIKKLCRALSNGITSDVMYSLAILMIRTDAAKIADIEEDAVVNYLVKNQDQGYSHIRDLQDPKRKLSQINKDKINAAAMALRFQGYNMDVIRRSPF